MNTGHRAKDTAHKQPQVHTAVNKRQEATDTPHATHLAHTPVDNPRGLF